jgi:ketosteroid isomerase-like protein
MPEESVELIPRIADAINRRNLDAFLALMDPEVVAVPRILAVEGGTLHGHEGIRVWWDGIFGAFPDSEFEAIAVRGIEDVTISHVLTRGRGHGSGAAFEDSIWVASRWRDGKVIWWQTCRSEAAALQGAGLSE